MQNQKFDLQEKILNSFKTIKDASIFLHTSPHNDDVMLGYLPYIQFLLRNGARTFNVSCANHYFATLTSGFNGVKDKYLDSWSKENSISLDWSKLSFIQKMKTKIRRQEELALWGSVGINQNNVFNLNLGFYGNKSFDWKPDFKKDVVPVLNLFEKIVPDIVTVAIDPRECGPNTHYKSLVVVVEAVSKYIEKYPGADFKIIGYRNVWSRFDVNDANIFYPVSLKEIKEFKGLFNKSYISQLDPAFPHDGFCGTFAELSADVFLKQYADIQALLGDEFLNENKKLKDAKGFILLKQMTPTEFLTYFETNY